MRNEPKEYTEKSLPIKQTTIQNYKKTERLTERKNKKERKTYGEEEQERKKKRLMERKNKNERKKEEEEEDKEKRQRVERLTERAEQGREKRWRHQTAKGEQR